MTTSRIATEYAASSSNIDTLIARLQAARTAHAQRAAAQPTHWGYVGDVKHIEQQLQELVVSLEA